MPQKKTAARSKSASSRKKPGRGTKDSEQYAKAVEAFERAVKNLRKGDFEKARSQFDSVASGFPEERELADRARMYLNICDRRLQSGRTYSPKDFESTVAYGVFLHNRGDFDKAAEHLAKAVEMNPKSDHAQYCLAACYARIGDSRGATRHLKRAINVDPYNRVLALSDADFDALRSDPNLSQMLTVEENPSTTP